MKTFLHTITKRIFRRKQIPDEQYVERFRKYDRSIRKMQWIWPILAAAMICLLIAFLVLIAEFFRNFPSDREMLYSGLILGIVFGLMISGLIVGAVRCISNWFDARGGFRAERLMLKYYDLLKQMEAQDPPEQGDAESHEPEL